MSDVAVSQITSLISAYPPPFLYVHDPATPRITSSSLQNALLGLQDTSSTVSYNLNLRCAFVDAVTCFTPRIFYDTVINALAGWIPDWNEGCSNWADSHRPYGQRFNDSLDAFLHGLRAVQESFISDSHRPGNLGSSELVNRDSQRAKEGGHRESRLVIVIERAERLKDSMPELLVPLTRLAELVCSPLLLPCHMP